MKYFKNLIETESNKEKTIFDSIFGLIKGILIGILFVIFIFFIWLFFDEGWAMFWLIIGGIYFIIQKVVKD